MVRIARVVSGQTLEVLDLDGQSASEQIRLIGVEAPAWKQDPWYMQAKQQLEDWIGTEKTVLLESDIQKQISRQNGSTLKLAYVWRGDRLLNEQLVAAGLVLAEVRSPNLKYAQRLTRAQEKARLLGRGIWDPTHPMRQTPNEFRKQQVS